MRRLAVLFAIAACHHPAHSTLFDERVIDTPPGISDLTIDDHGTLWGIAERTRSVIAIDGVDGAPRVMPLDGVAEGDDTEALTWLGGDRFAIGLEGAEVPTAAIAYATLQGGHMVVSRTIDLPTAELGVTLTKNHGVEGLCGHGDVLLAAIETVGVVDGKRWAPLVRIEGDRRRVVKLWLTSDKGKISALSCRFAADGTIEIEAIERHYEVSRILRATVAPGAVEVTPVIELDLAPVLRNTLNLEGLVRLLDGRLVAINDNEGSHVDGPTELLVFKSR